MRAISYQFFYNQLNKRISNAMGVVAALIAIHFTSATSQAQSVSIGIGNEATLVASAAGTAPFSFIWSKNGVPVPNATSETFTISGASTVDAGTYSVLVSNALGSTQSAPIVVAV